MNTKTKLSLVAILASCFCMAIGSAQAAARHHQAAMACAAQPGTMRALFCPAPAAPTKPSHHRHAKA
jgi:hypothetical protein